MVKIEGRPASHDSDVRKRCGVVGLKEASLGDGE